MANIPPNHPITAEKAARSPKCARCRNHGFVVPLKGHLGKCQFRSCICWKCSLVAERTKILAAQRRIKTVNGNESPSACRPGHSTESGGKTIFAATNINGVTSEPDTSAVQEGSKALGGTTDADGKTYIELHVPVTGPVSTASTTADGCELKTPTEPSASDCAPGDPPPFPGERVITEAIPRHIFPGEMFAMPLPLYLHHPDRYMYPAVLVSLRPPAPAPFREPTGFLSPPPVAQSQPLETYESQLHMPYYSSYPTYPVLKEEPGPKPYYQLQPHMDGHQGTSTLPPQAEQTSESHVCGAQEPDAVALDGLSSKKTLQARSLAPPN